MKELINNIMAKKYYIVLTFFVMTISCQAFYNFFNNLFTGIFYYSVVGVTFLLLFLTNRNLYFNKNSIHVIFYFAWIFFQIFIVQFCYNFHNFNIIAGFEFNLVTIQLLQLCATLLNSVIFLYRTEFDNFFLKLSVIVFIFNFIFTMKALALDPNICKIMATGDASAYTSLSTFGVVGYNYIYGLVFVVPFLLEWFKKSKNKAQKIKLAIAIIFIVFFIYKSSYFTALCLLCFSILLFVFLNLKKSVKKILIPSLTLFVIIGFATKLFAYILLFVADFIPIYNIYERVHEIAIFLLTGEVGVTLARLDLYMISINLFLEHPLIGNAFYNIDYAVSGHAEILDILAHGGILLFALFALSFFFYFKRLYKLCENSSSKNAVIILMIIFICLNLINTSFSSGYIYFVMFIICPVLIRKLNKKGEKNNESTLAM